MCWVWTYSFVQVDGVLARHDVADGSTTFFLGFVLFGLGGFVFGHFVERTGNIGVRIVDATGGYSPFDGMATVIKDVEVGNS